MAESSLFLCCGELGKYFFHRAMWIKKVFHAETVTPLISAEKANGLRPLKRSPPPLSISFVERGISSISLF
jgi:hypothetical protein